MARVAATTTLPRRMLMVSSSSTSRVVSDSRGFMMSGYSWRIRMSCRYQSSIRACSCSERSSHRSTASRMVSGDWGSGTCWSHPIRENSRLRPAVTMGPSSGPRSLKKGKGVEAAHSSPMNSIGVYGDSR